jgi:predicted Zn-dependent protease
MTRTLLQLLTALAIAIAAGAVTGTAYAEPFLPASDDQVLERLPYKATDPAMAELRAERSQLREQPDNLRLALRIARRYTELGRINGDPRYAGYAQAALMSWWNLERPPQEVLLLRATLRQRVHDFDNALVDLNTLIRLNPWNAQARLTRATVLQVQGHYAAARSDCQQLQRLTDELVSTVCLTSIDSVTGHLHDSYEQLRLALERHPEADSTIRSWVLTALAEMAARTADSAATERYFRQALEIDPDDFYLLGAYCDFLLEQHRPAEVTRLLADKTSADPLLLRYALALKAERSPQLTSAQRQLSERFAASHLRGDRVHLREEARFALHVLDDAPRALQLAKENWSVQKEVADVRILLEAALSTPDEATLKLVKDWLGTSQLEDPHLTHGLELITTNR